MDKRTAAERIRELRTAINRYRYAYHVQGESLISDAAQDSLKKELFDLEQEFPDLVTADSPTQRVGGAPLKEFKKARHERPMISMNDAFSEDDMRAWFARLENFLDKKVVPEFYCEPKIDGLAIELVYENGVLVQGSTRGDGVVGEDVTQNLKTVEAIPLKINLQHTTNNPQSNILKRLVVRGEIFLTKKEFNRINREQEKKGLKPYANPRNVAAGSVRQLDPKITAARKLDSFQYEVVTDVGQKTHAEEHDILRALGFKTNSDTKLVHSLEEVFRYRDAIGKKRDRLSYEIDGVVVIVNSNTDFSLGGVTGKAPRAEIAFKFGAREATTIVLDIQVQIGRTGVLTPVAHLRPVQVSGVTISHATLHNEDEIKRLGLKVGDTVIVSRAGDVIPKITQVLPELRTGKEKAFHFPTKCPFDGSAIVREGALIRCSNVRCGARQRESLYHFVSRGAFNLEGLGPKIIDRFIDENLVSDAADIFDIKKGDIEVLARFGEKSAKNITSEIEAKKHITLPKFIFSLGILHVGEETALALSSAISNFQFSISKPKDLFEAFKKLSQDDLQKIPDIGPKVSESIHAWFRDAHNAGLIKKLDRAGISIESYKSLVVSRKLVNLTFVLTGTLETLSREQAKEKIRALGGDVAESVSKNTSYVVVGADPGSKADKAKKLGVTIVDEKAFLNLIK